MDITKLKIGETVYFDGEFQYANMHSMEPIECKAGEAVVINIWNTRHAKHNVCLKGESINGWVDGDYVKSLEEAKNKESIIWIETEDVEIRKSAGNYSKKMGYAEIGKHTIVNIKEGKGSETGWGELSTGEGWIPLDKVKRL